MARKEVTQYFDDLDGTELKGDDVNVIRFAFEGKHYFIDLSAANAAEFRRVMARYIENAHSDTRAANARSTTPRRNHDPAVVREWATKNGLQVSDRGKIPHHILKAYNEAH